MAGKIFKMISSFPCFQAKNTDPSVQHQSNFSASHIFKQYHYETPQRAILCCWKKTIIVFWFSSLMMKLLEIIISLEREHALVTKLINGTKMCIISYLLERHTHTTTITSHSVCIFVSILAYTNSHEIKYQINRLRTISYTIIWLNDAAELSSYHALLLSVPLQAWLGTGTNTLLEKQKNWAFCFAI